jgi:LemA protein
VTNNYNAYPWGRWIKWGIIALVIIILLSSAISTYNGLVSADQDVKSKWSQVENVMQARADKIGDLVEVVKEYSKHEEGVLEKIAAARAEFDTAREILDSQSQDVRSKLDADAAAKNAAQTMINIVVENYPELKSSRQFENLQEAIEGAENRISVERSRFIKSVENYNLKVSRFPGNIFARLMGFTPKDYFEASDYAKERTKIDFGS